MKKYEYRTEIIRFDGMTAKSKASKLNNAITEICNQGWELVTIAVGDMLSDWVNYYTCVFKRELV